MRAARTRPVSVTRLTTLRHSPQDGPERRLSRLRGDLEHLSYETAVARYMAPEAVLRRYYADRRFHVRLSAVVLVAVAAVVGLFFV